MINIITKYTHCREDQLVLNVMNVARQANGNNCGLYAVAYATSFLFEDDPTELQCDGNLLRSSITFFEVH